MAEWTATRARMIGLTVLMAWVAVTGAVAAAAPGIGAVQASDHAASAPEIIKALGIAAGSHVADVGSGAGAFTVPLAKAVGPTGRVYAVDIDERILEKLRARVQQEGLQNVEIIKGDVDNPQLPAGVLDAMLVMHAYHEMTAFPSMLSHFREALKPEGRLVIVEPLSRSRRDAPRSSLARSHEMAPWFVSDELRAAGLQVTELRDPYSSHNQHEEWLLVARRSTLPSAAAPPSAERDAAFRRPAQPETSQFSDADLAVPEIRISMAEFLKAYEADRVVVVDVRGEDDYAAGHIPGALSIPLDQLERRMGELTSRRKALVVYSAEESSARAVLMLERLRMTGQRALTGGFDQWVAEKRPVEKGK